MNWWIAIDRQARILLGPIESGTFLDRDAINRNDSLPGHNPGERGRSALENKRGEITIPDAESMKSKRRLRLIGQLGDEIAVALFREQTEMRSRHVGEEPLR